MALVMNLQKMEESKKSLSLCLQKAGVITPPALDLAIVMDVSGSFKDEHEEGVTNDLMTRLVPWGLTFDPDQKLDVITFSNGPGSVQETPAITAHNYQGYVQREIVNKVRGWCGATDYSYPLETALTNFGWINNEAKKAGFLGKMFGKKDEAPKEKKRSLVLFVTDGDNNDHERTMSVLRASEQRKDGVYFLFIGVANGGGEFTFLKKIGDAFSNTGFVEISNLRKFVQMSDADVNAMLLDQELLDWMKS